MHARNVKRFRIIICVLQAYSAILEYSYVYYAIRSTFSEMKLSFPQSEPLFYLMRFSVDMFLYHRWLKNRNPFPFVTMVVRENGETNRHITHLRS